MESVCAPLDISQFNLNQRGGLDVGTDATIAQHIETIIERGYVIPRPDGGVKYLVPSTLGIGLVDGYNEIGFEKSLSKPQLRRDVRSLLVFLNPASPAII